MILYLGFILDVLGFVLKGGLVADPAFVLDVFGVLRVKKFVDLWSFMWDETHEDSLYLSSSSGSSVGSVLFAFLYLSSIRHCCTPC
jgi:hypothetical protein